MPTITTFVFFDIETTGLPHQERNQTKITECSFVAVSRKDLETTSYGQNPPVSKLTFVLNPERPIHPEVVKLTGLSNELLQNSPVFRQKVKSLITFIEDLPKPVCLVAHNGNVFDFKILLTECNEAGACLPEDLLCVDSLVGFRALLKDSNISYKDLGKIHQESLNCRNLASLEATETTNPVDLLTDDEDEWPDLNITNEEWDEIDAISSTLSNISCEEIEEPICTPKKEINEPRNRAKADSGKKTVNNDYKLSTLYKRLLNKEEKNAHRAEVDCSILAECVIAMRKEFLPWADRQCKLLTEVKPLIRY